MSSILLIFAVCSNSLIFALLSFSSGVRFLLDIFLTSIMVLLLYTIMEVYTIFGMVSLVLKNLNIPHKGFHSLRHTFATRALECGMDVKTLSEILGHKNPTVTLNRYVHSLMEHKKEMMNKLGKLL